jgi:hypothetical protein
MSIIKEYREFFLRAIQVPTGTKADKQINYPAQYQVTDINGKQIMAFNRFLKEHFPSEDVFKKLFESIAFKINPEDTATVPQQGLVRIVTGEGIVAREDVILDGTETFATVVVPSTLPVVEGGTNITVVAEIVRSSDDVIVASIPPGDTQSYYIKYTVNADSVVTGAGGGTTVDPGGTVVLGGTLNDGPTIFTGGVNSTFGIGNSVNPVTNAEVWAASSVKILNLNNTTGIEMPGAGSGINIKTSEVSASTANIGDYLTLIDNGTGEAEWETSKYVLEFGVADWAGIKLTIPANVHKRGLFPLIQIYYTSGGANNLITVGAGTVYVDFIKVEIGEIIINSGTGGNFDGVLIVM